MTFGRTYMEFLHDLLYLKHVEDPATGYCLTCSSPRRFHPCPVRQRIVARLIELGHLGGDERKKLVRGDCPCTCDKGLAGFVPC